MGGKFLSIGECMVELSQAGDGLLRRGFAGDTLNTAWYARACLPTDWDVDYFTALGDDPMSAEMLAMMQKAGIGTQNIRQIPGKTPGLYLITLKDGERTFSYWRDTAAAKKLADDADHLRTAIEASDVIYFSGITLGILGPEAIDTLLSELRRAKASGKTVVFDPNIRPRLWPAGKAVMLKTIEDGARAATIVLPSFDDEKAHFGDADVAETVARYHALGVPHVVVKDGPNGISLSFGGAARHVPAVEAQAVVDTTSAGDSFNGGFLSRLLTGTEPQDAAAYGAAVATTVIGHHGALIDFTLLPK